ncbi:MAG: ankyrin repeat domain-containing protein [Proteobacteria bacterium]|nr:ankyrin repeat domain-containing protein [Pseudomonadota bacterium]
MLEAIQKNDLEEICALLKKDINVDSHEDNGQRPLSLALALDRTQIIKLLIKANANVNFTDNNGKTFFENLEEKQNYDLIKVAVEKGAEIPKESEILKMAIDSNDLEFVKILIDKGIDLNKCFGEMFSISERAFEYAYTMGKYDIVLTLLKHDIELKETRLVRQTIKDKNQDIFDALITKFKEIPEDILDRATDMACELFAVDNSYYLEKLVNQIDIDKTMGYEEQTLVHKAAKLGNLDLLECLAKNNADLTILNKFKEPPAQIALKKNHFEFYKKIMDITAGTICDQSYEPPLIEFCRSNDVKMVNDILAKKCQVNYANVNGETALHIACTKGNMKIVETLLAHGANPFMMDKSKKTPLMLAAENKHLALQIKLFTYAMRLEDVKQIRQLDLANKYQHNLKNMSKMIILGIDAEPSFKHLKNLKLNLNYSNFEGYSKDHKVEWGKKGDALTLTYKGENYPIGYKILIPPQMKKIDKVIIIAYGGNTSKNLNQQLNVISKEQKLFYHLGYPVVDLVLPDSLKDECPWKMSKKLHKLIHGAINEFFKRISTEPEMLHHDFKDVGFANAAYFLYGGSFGGRTSIRHSQMYPGTFKGYISQEGNFGHFNDMPIVPGYNGEWREFKFLDVLAPLSNIQDCKDPMLILQNRDDNNVNIETTLGFYEALKKQGKENLARLVFFEEGNGTPGKAKTELHNKGHFFPKDIDRYMDVIRAFIEGTSYLPEIQEHAYEMQARMVDQFSRRYFDSDRFVSLACKQYYNNAQHQKTQLNTPSWNDIWTTQYKPLVVALREIETLCDNPVYLNQYLQYIQDNHLLTKQVLKNAINEHAGAFRQLYRELNKYDEISLEEITENPYILEAFEEKLLNCTYTESFYKSFLLESLLFSNPSLVMPIEKSKAWSVQRLEQEEPIFRTAFENRIMQGKKITQRAWLCLAKTAREKSKEMSVMLQNEARNIDTSDPQAIYKMFFKTNQVLVRNVSEVKAIQQEMLNVLTQMTKQNLSEIAAKDQHLKVLAEKALNNQFLQLTNEEFNAIDVVIKQNTNNDFLLPLLSLCQTKITDDLAWIKCNEYLAQCLKNKILQQEVLQQSIEKLKNKHPCVKNVNARKFIDHLRTGINLQDPLTLDSPLHKAIEEKNLELVKLLVENGANHDVKNLNGESILNAAMRVCKTYILPYIYRETIIKKQFTR